MSVPPSVPEPAGDPRWSPADAGSGRRTLSRDAIVAVAVRIADADGLEAVSMPRLARELGAAPMSLYRHVANKDALVDLVLDDAIGDPPDLSGLTPRAGLEAWARANHHVFRLHPWTLPLVSTSRRMGPNECAWAEAVLTLLVGAGSPLAQAAEVLMTVNNFVRGASVPAVVRLPLATDVTRSGRDLPLFAQLLSVAVPEGDGDPMFERGLRLVLDGVVRGSFPEAS